MNTLLEIKNLLLLVVVSLPLCFLAIQNVLRGMSSPVKEAEASEEKPADYGTLIASTRAEVQAERPGLQTVSHTDLFGDSPLFDLTLPGMDPTAWAKMKKAKETAHRLAKIYRDAVPMDPEVERSELEQLANNSQAWDGLSEAQPLREWIAARIKTLSVLIENKAVLVEARKALDDKKYTMCLANLARLHREALTPQQSQAAASWDKMARFKKHWAPTRPTTDLAVRARELEAQLKETPDPYDDESEALIAEQKQALNGLKVELRRLALFKSLPDLAEILEECEALTKDDPTILPKLRADVRDWLSRQIAEQKPRTKAHPNVKEAWLKAKPVRVEGVFEAVGAGPDLRYQVWDLEDWLAKATRPGKYSTYYLSALEGEPKRPVEPRVVDDFNRSRRELLAKLDSEEAWKGFHEKVGELQDELNAYYSRIGKDPQEGVSFQNASDIADMILTKWDVACEFLAMR